MNSDVVKKVIALTEGAKTQEELFNILVQSAHAVGGMVCHFDKEDRSQIMMELIQTMATGFQITSKSLGEPSDLEMVVGERS